MVLYSQQIRAARAMVGLSAKDLAALASVGISTVQRAELAEGEPQITKANLEAIRRTLEAAGVEFIPENGGGPGVRMRKPGGHE